MKAEINYMFQLHKAVNIQLYLSEI